MNICILSERFPHEDNMEFVFVKKLVDEWAKMGHTCYVFTCFSWGTYLAGQIKYKPASYEYEVEGGNRVKVYNPRIWTSKKVNIAGINMESYFSRIAFNRFASRIGVKFDFIYCHFFRAAINAFQYAERHRIPFFVATGESSVPSLRKPYRAFCWKDFAQTTNGVIAVSSKNREESTAKGYIKAEKCQVFPNATNLATFHPMDKGECRRKLGFPEDAFIMICVGYLCKRKGQDRVLEAVRRLNNKNIKLIFIGNTAKKNGLELESDSIIFKGSVYNHELPMYLNASDAFCLPTLHEGCCNAIIEAMACRLPIISSDLPFNHDVLNKENALLVDPNNVDEISKAISTLYNDHDLRERLAHIVYESSQDLDLPKRARNILDFIQERKKN